MSCIVGICQNGKVYMGADSAGVCPKTGALQLRKDPKVFKNGEYLIGVAGSWPVAQELRYAKLPVDDPADAFEYMTQVFLCELRLILSKLPKEDYELLVGFRGRLFHLYGSEQVSEEIADYEACGSGAQVARGALYAWENLVMPTEERIEGALRAAERFCSGVRGPFTILESE
jgi:ATP-dependent protease HslVU (ClpYQ) peptidase subunit